MNEIMLETGRFSTTGAWNEEFLRRNARHFLSRKYLIQLWVIYIIGAACMFGLYLYARSPLHLVLMALMLLFPIFRMWQYKKRWLKLTVARLKETYPEGEEILTVSCTEQGIRMEKPDGGSATVAYESLAKAVETEDCILVFTKAKQVTVFFKSSLTAQECEELKAFLREKGVKVK